MACLALLNYLNAFYLPSGFIDSENDCGIIKPGSRRSGIDCIKLGGAIQNVRPVRGSRYCVDTISLRNYLKDCVNNDSESVPWQLDYIRRI